MAELSEWEPIFEKTVELLRSTWTQLQEIWVDIGYSTEVQSMYRDQAYAHIEALLKDMVLESKHKKKDLVNNVKCLLEKIAVLNKELGQSSEMTGSENLQLIEIEKLLQVELENLQYRKEERLIQLNELLEKERSICKLLGTQAIGIDEKLLSEEELASFKLYLEKQEEEKNRLESIFKDTRKAIIKMMDDLGIVPSLNFEHLVHKNPDNFVLSASNMAKLKELRDQLKIQTEEAKQHVEEMQHELIALWKYLDEPEQVCQSFLDSCLGFNVATINALGSELKRCKEKRKQNVARCVEHMRTELVRLWDLCKYSENQRKEFVHFNSNTYTEDLLTLHELEVERIQHFYRTNKSIFELLEERENLWTKMRELLQRANNPNRFHNRGGQLLMEEKERKTIQKKLPKIEEQLRSLIKEYEDVNGETFTVNDMSIEELLKESWATLNEEKETIKNARKEAKDKSVKKVLLSASKKRPNVVSTLRHTPLSSKRRLLFTPSPNASAKRRNLCTGSGSKVRRSGNTTKRLLRSTGKKLKSTQKKENCTSQNSTAADSTYSQFKEHLEDKKELRSSLLPEQLLANSTKSRMKTPVKTPAKPLRKKLMLSTTPNTTSKMSQSQSTNKTARSPRAPLTKLTPASTPLPIIF